MNALDFRKRAIMSVINNVKGFERSVSGTSVTLEGCVDDDSIIDYKIYGNCFQDGEPSIENPIEVQCVGDRTKNLITATDGYIVKHAENRYIKYDAKTQVFTIQGSGFLTYINLPETIPSGTTTSIFVEIVNDDYEFVKGSMNIGGYGIVSSWQNLLSFSATSQKKQSRVYTITEDTDKICMFVDANASVKNVQVRITYAVCDTEFTEYEPYGYKIPITASGKNLFNENLLSGGYGIEEYNGVRCLKFADGSEENCFKITYDFKENTAYSITMTIYSNNTNTMNLRVYYTDGTYITINTGQTKINETFWFSIRKSSKTVAYICACDSWMATRYLDLTTLQIEEGSKATEYEPYYEPITTNIYLDEPLRGIDSYLDCVGYKNENVTREVWKMYFTDMSAIYMGEGYASAGNGFYNNGICFPSGNPNNIYAMKIMTAGGGFCNKLPNHKGNYYIVTKESLRFGQVQRGIILYTSLDSKDKTEVFNHIGAEDCYAVYILNNSFETPITLPKLPTFKGTTIYTVGTSLQPANIEIKYYSNEKGE